MDNKNKCRQLSSSTASWQQQPSTACAPESERFISDGRTLIPAPGILWRAAADAHVPSGEPSAPAERLYRGWPRLSPPQKPAQSNTDSRSSHRNRHDHHPSSVSAVSGASVCTFSSVGMVSLSLAIRLDTCSMPRLRNSSLPTTSVKCCSEKRNGSSVQSARSPSFSPQILTKLCCHERQRCKNPPRNQPTCVAVGLCEELRAGVQVGEGSDSQAVGRMKLRAQELAAGFFHLVQLEQARCRQQRLSHTNTHTFVKPSL